MTKSITKRLICTTLDALQLKKLMIESIYSVNPFCMFVNHASGYFEEKNENKYLVSDSTDENKEVLKKYTDQNSKWW